jgi:hypothetical protein
MPNVKIASIIMPEHYVRGKINGKNVSDLMDVVVKTHGHLFKDGKAPDWHELISKKLTWPFHTPIELAKNPTPTPGKALKKSEATLEGRGKKKGRVFKPFELIDGGHRLTVWRRLKQKEIPATIKDIKDPAERFKEQYETNSSHGLRLDKDQRDNYVRVAHTVYRKSLSILAKETGLHRNSIIRILAEKQRKKTPRQKKGEFTTGQSLQSDMSVQGFIDRIQILTTAFPRLKDQIKAFLIENITTSGKSKLSSLVSQVRDIATTLEAPLIQGVSNGTKA